ncbi:PepSY domain-containing protein [Pseudonocardia sulfidoxydans]|uniref:PepSY domain-containing protein n=1 Tax=Pseudonocardia sulfidoxydans TaxID=54011 RepID=UPI00360CF8D4
MQVGRTRRTTDLEDTVNIRRPVVLAAATGVTLLALTGTALALGTGGDDSTTRTPTVPTTSTSSTGAPPTPLLTDTAQAAVDRSAAEQAAVAHVGGGQVVEVEREFEHGRQVWEVDVRTTSGLRELHVDTATGQVTRDRLDDDDDDDDDRRVGDDDRRVGDDDRWDD